MNDTTKKIGLIAIAAVAIVIAIFGAMKMTSGEKMTVDQTIKMPAGFKSEKQAALDAQAAGGKGTAAPERDLSK